MLRYVRSSVIRKTTRRISPFIASLGVAASLIGCEDPVPTPPIGLAQLTVDEDSTSALRCASTLPRESIPEGSEAFSYLDSPSQRDELPMAEGGVGDFQVECTLLRREDGSYEDINVQLQSPGRRLSLRASGTGSNAAGTLRWVHPTTAGELSSSTCQIEISPDSDDSQVLMQFDCTGMKRSGITEACRALGAVFVDSCSN